MIYESLDSMWLDVVKRLRQAPEQPSRDGNTSELIGYHGVLIDPRNCWLTNAGRKLSPFYAAAEILWYAHGTPNVDMIAAYALQYKRFAEADGNVFGAYGPRLTGSPPGFDKIRSAIDALSVDRDSRRVVISLWEGDDLLFGNPGALKRVGTGAAVKDVPCTLSWQFLIRNDMLHMEVNMRSQDVWLGMPYDVFWNCTVMHMVANELGLRLGQYAHNCGSIHCYERNREGIDLSIAASSDPQPVWDGDRTTWRMLRDAAKCEEQMRESNTLGVQPTIMTRTLLELCRLQQHGTPMSDAVDPVLKKAAHDYH